MTCKNLLFSCWTSAVLLIGLFWSTVSAAQTEKVLHSFDLSGDGHSPMAALTFDDRGNLYGTTVLGGHATECAGGCGTVFKMTPNQNGTWNETVIHEFDGQLEAWPGWPVVFDRAGNLWGTTWYVGSVFELLPQADGTWREIIVHTFGMNGDGAIPQGPLLIDSAGRAFGTTQAGGSSGKGTVYEIDLRNPVRDSVLYSFDRGLSIAVSRVPGGSLLKGADGSLFGTTFYGGPDRYGSVYQLIPTGSGWREKDLYFFGSFLNNDGAGPEDGLVSDSTGNLYGTTSSGGSGECNWGCGTVFELSPQPDGSWKESVIHTFQGGLDGASPFGKLAFDQAGQLLGTTTAGGYRAGYFGYGTVFRLTPNPEGQWTETVLYRFSGGADGSAPDGGVILDRAGNLFGTTQAGGTYGVGTVFEITQ